MHPISKKFSLIVILFFTACDDAKLEYYPDGKLKSRREISSSTSVLDGESTEYSEDGSLSTISYYNNNKLDGKRCTYYESGDLKQVESFGPSDGVSNTKESVSIESVTKYYPTTSGSSLSNLIPTWIVKKFECTFLEEFLRNKESTTEYSNGKPTKVTEYDANGSIVETFVFSKWGEPLSTKVIKHFELVRSLLSAQKQDEALNELNKIVQTIPNLSTGYVLRANIFDQQKKFNKAIEEYQRAVALNPLNADAHFGLGQALSHDGDFLGALPAFENAARIDPSVKHFTYLGIQQRILKNFDSALASFQYAAEVEPKNSFVQSQLGDVLLELDRNDQALEAYQKSVDLNPNYGPHWMTFARFLLRTGREEEAIPKLQKVISLLNTPTKNPVDNSTALASLIDAYWGLGDVDSFYQLLTKNDTLERASINLSVFYDEIGERSIAISRLQDKTLASFNNKIRHYNLGEALYLSGKTKDAINELNNALGIDPDDVNASALLGKALLDEGKVAEARIALESALKLQPKSALAHQQLFRLNHIKKFYSMTEIDSQFYNEALLTLVKTSTGPDLYARRRSMWLLGVLVLDDSRISDYLSSGLNDRNDFIRINAMWGLANAGTLAKKHSTIVAAMLEDKNPWIVRQAVRTLTEISNLKELSTDTRSKMVRRMIEELHHADPLIRRYACINLGRLGVYAMEALPDLKGLATDIEMQINEESAEAIALISTP